MELHAVQSNSSSTNGNIGTDQSHKALMKRNSRNSNKRHSRRLNLHRNAVSIQDLCSAQMQNHSFDLAPGLPPSAIVFDAKLTMREKIVALCDKYIVSGGEFELNLGSQHRMDLLRKKGILDELEDDECAAIFNATIYGIIALVRDIIRFLVLSMLILIFVFEQMHDSFIRFQQTNSYEQLRREFARNQ